MTPTELLQLFRTSSSHEMFREFERLYDSDQSFYERLVTFAQRTQRKTCDHSWEAIGDPQTHQRCKRCGKTLLIPVE